MKNILVIEEDRDLSRLLCQFLREHNFYALEAVNPEHGFSLVRDRYPDLVICSFELLAFDRTKCPTDREICDTFSSVKIPWVLLVAETSMLNISGKINLSEVTILKKPLELNLLLAVICDELNEVSSDNVFDEIRAVLKHWYCFEELESLLNYEQKNKSGKIQKSLDLSKKHVILSRRHTLLGERLGHNLKIKLARK